MATELALRPVRAEDRRTVQKMFVEFNASPFGKFDPIEHTDEAHVSAFLESMARDHVIYAVTRAGSDEMIGYVCFHIAGEEFDIGYMIDAQYRGAGIATAASRAAMERVSGERGARSFTATVAAENLPSVRVLEKLGFTIASETRVKKTAAGETFSIMERRYVNKK